MENNIKEKWYQNKWTVGLCVFVAIIVAILIFQTSTDITPTQVQNSTNTTPNQFGWNPNTTIPTTQTKTTTSTQQVENNNFALQSQCADESAKLFKQLGYSYGSTTPIDSFSNHWNKTMSKCFILITSADYSQGGGTEIDLIDTAESKRYGEFFAITGIDIPAQCFIFETGDENDKSNTRTCASESQYNDFVRPYMNN